MRKFALVLAIGLFAAACSSPQENELGEALQEIQELENQLRDLDELSNEEGAEEILEEIKALQDQISDL